MDRLTVEQRHKNMQAVKNKDSKIELKLRLALFHKGYRYRKNYRKIYGCPDIAFTKEKVVVFVDSEFWHGFDWENRKHDLKSNTEFWINKIERNMDRDASVNSRLAGEGFLVLRFWGKEINKDLDKCIMTIENALAQRRIIKDKG